MNTEIITLKDIAHHLNAEYRQRNQEYHADCPFCGKPAKRSQTHFSFSANGFYCWVCGENGGLKSLAAHIGIDSNDNGYEQYIAPQSKEEPSKDDKPVWWYEQRNELLKRYINDKRYAAWGAYGLTTETVETNQFGYGCLPSKNAGQFQKTARLIVPIFDESGELTGFRGRLPKGYRGRSTVNWLSAIGTRKSLWGIHKLPNAQDKVIVICANHRDGALLEQRQRKTKGVEIIALSPTAGESSNFDDDWVKAIAQAKPKAVCVIYDNDTTGKQGSAKLLRQLSDADIHAIAWQWSQNEPDKADLGDILSGKVAGDIETFIKQAVASAPLHINTRYLSDAMPTQIDQKFLFIKSPMGTGKTHWISRYVSKFQKVLYLTHRSSLNRNIEHRLSHLGFVSHLDAKHIASSDRSVITINSLHKLLDENGALPRYDCIVIDESDQVTKHLKGGTFSDREGMDALNILRQLCKMADQVICCDANLSPLTNELLGNPNPLDTLQVINDYPMPHWANVDIYQNKTSIDTLLAQALGDGQKCFVVCDSIQQVKELHTQYADIRPLVIHGDNSQTPEIQAILRNLDGYLDDCRLLIASPSIASGVDIQTHFDCGFGYYSGSTSVLTSEEITQQLGRFRNVDQVNIYMPSDPEQPNRITDIEKLIKMARDAFTSQFGIVPNIWDNAGKPVLSRDQESYLSLWAASTAKDNKQLNAPREHLIAILEATGYEVTAHSEDTRLVNEAVQGKVKSAKDLQKLYEKQMTFDSEPIDHDIYRSLASNGQSSPEIEYGHKRYEVEELFGQEINDEIYKEFRHKSAFLRFTDLLTDDKHLWQLDQDELDNPLSKQAKRHFRKRLIRTILAKLFGYDLPTRLTTNAAANLTWEYEDMKRLMRWLYPNRELIHSVLGVNIASYKGWHNLIRALLATIGMKQAREEIGSYTGKDGKRHKEYRYHLDVDQLTKYMRLAQIRMQKHGIPIDQKLYGVDEFGILIPQKTCKIRPPSSLVKCSIFGAITGLGQRAKNVS